MKVLVADDDAVTRTAVCAAVDALGFVSIEAANGKAAWESYGRDADIRVLIVDWIMPEVDGPELCRRIRQDDRSEYTYIIMLTVKGGKSAYLEGMRAGADDFMTKPLDREELAVRLEVAKRILALQRELNLFQRLLPICAHCKKIRDEQGVWHGLDEYLSEETDARFTHSVCPVCYKTVWQPQLDRLSKSRNRQDK